MCSKNYSEQCYTSNYALELIGFLRENRDKVEVYLAFGATRMEACKPIAIDALVLALTPVINQMRSAPTNEGSPFLPPSY